MNYNNHPNINQYNILCNAAVKSIYADVFKTSDFVQVPEENAKEGQTRPQYIELSSQTPDAEVLYPEGCEDQISLAGR